MLNQEVSIHGISRYRDKDVYVLSGLWAIRVVPRTFRLLGDESLFLFPEKGIEDI